MLFLSSCLNQRKEHIINQFYCVCVSLQYNVYTFYTYTLLYFHYWKEDDKNLDMSERYVIEKPSTLHPDTVIKPSHPGKMLCSNVSEAMVETFVGKKNGYVQEPN